MNETILIPRVLDESCQLVFKPFFRIINNEDIKKQKPNNQRMKLTSPK